MAGFDSRNLRKAAGSEKSDSSSLEFATRLVVTSVEQTVLLRKSQSICVVVRIAPSQTLLRVVRFDDVRLPTFRNDRARKRMRKSIRAALTSTRGRTRPHAMARTSAPACRKSGRTVTADNRQQRPAATQTATFSVGPCTTRSSNNPDMTTRSSCPPIEASASSATAFPGLRVRFQSPQISGRAGLCLFVT